MAPASIKMAVVWPDGKIIHLPGDFESYLLRFSSLPRGFYSVLFFGATVGGSLATGLWVSHYERKLSSLRQKQMQEQSAAINMKPELNRTYPAPVAPGTAVYTAPPAMAAYPSPPATAVPPAPPTVAPGTAVYTAPPATAAYPSPPATAVPPAMQAYPDAAAAPAMPAPPDRRTWWWPWGRSSNDRS